MWKPSPEKHGPEFHGHKLEPQIKGKKAQSGCDNMAYEFSKMTTR